LGKGEIISGGTDGLYNIKVILNRAGIAKMIAKINENIAQYQLQITALNARLDLLAIELASIQSQINAYKLDINTYQKQLEAALQSQTDKIVLRDSLLRLKSIANFKIKSMQARIAYLNQNMPEDPVLPAWCADLTEDLTGEVATIEVPGERGTVLICPGDYSEYDAEVDGQLNPAINQTPEQCFYNLAMLPGWQKWLPTYRFGTITAVDPLNNTCSVTLEDIKSNQQGLSINKEASLSGVPVEYMT
jgi:uncharacterized coiled-coil protein SlyX